MKKVGILLGMQLIHSNQLKAFNLPASVVTIGNFDGLHLGHKYLIEQLIIKSKQYGLPSVLMTFDPHPSAVLNPQGKVKKLFNINDLASGVERLGIDYVVVIDFTPELAEREADSFLQDLILTPLRPKCLVVGYDFCFGKDRTGDHHFLKNKAEAYNYELVIGEAVSLSGEIVSSSLIRQRLLEGDVVGAGELLGRNFFVRGEVLHGDGRGKALGFATANLSLGEGIVPATGVYVTKVSLEGNHYPAVTNVGRRPTFTKGKAVNVNIESHLLDENLNLYGREIKVEFLKPIRAEMKFEDVDELKQQIAKDIEFAKKEFNL